MVALIVAAWVSGAVAVGAGATALMTEDRRTTGIAEDEYRTQREQGISDKYGKNDGTRVISFNRYVLIVGQVPDEELKKQIGVTVLGIENVRNIRMIWSSVLRVIWPAHDDTYITSRSAHSENNSRPATSSRNEDDVVYLMGLVTKEGRRRAISLRVGG
jgi:osmotically-inducible protein OsmY